MQYMTEQIFSSLKIYGPSDKRNEIEQKLPSVMSAQNRSSKPGPSQSSAMPPPNRATAPYASYADPGFSDGDPWSAGYGASMAIPPTQSTEALRKQQESFARAEELKQMLSSLEKVDDEGRRGSLLDTLCSTEDVLGLPEHPNPPGIASGELRVDLLRHQVCDYSVLVRGFANAQFTCVFTEASLTMGDRA
jgi:SWI/SNF-related matrix-associated actin-dependent regulator of chromatin subfamily A3